MFRSSAYCAALVRKKEQVEPTTCSKEENEQGRDNTCCCALDVATRTARAAALMVYPESRNSRHALYQALSFEFRDGFDLKISTCIMYSIEMT